MNACDGGHIYVQGTGVPHLAADDMTFSAVMPKPTGQPARRKACAVHTLQVRNR